MIELFLLFLVHFLGDYTHFSTSHMLKAKQKGEPYLPIFAHASIHAFLVGIVLINFTTVNLAIYGFLFELITHFIIDVAKGKLNVLSPTLSNPSNKYHWYVFGLDQYLHAIVSITIYFKLT